MDMHPVTIGLPDPLLRAAQDLAQARDISLGALIRAALSAEVRRANLPAKMPNRADERLVDPLRALLAVDFGTARDWPDLQARLAAKGCVKRGAGWRCMTIPAARACARRPSLATPMPA